MRAELRGTCLYVGLEDVAELYRVLPEELKEGPIQRQLMKEGVAVETPQQLETILQRNGTEIPVTLRYNPKLNTRADVTFEPPTATFETATRISVSLGKDGASRIRDNDTTSSYNGEVYIQLE